MQDAGQEEPAPRRQGHRQTGQEQEPCKSLFYLYPISIPLYSSRAGAAPELLMNILFDGINDDTYFIVCPQLVMFEYSEAKVYSTFDETHPRVFSDD